MRYAALILGGVLLLALPAQAAHRTESKIRTIQLVSRTVSAKLVVDRAPKGLSKGDKISETSRRNAVPQFGRPKDALVGSDVAVMTLISAVRTKITVTVTLPGGTIRTAGTVSDDRQKIPVVGGTGVFAGARGMSDVQSLSADDRLALNIYRLRFP